MKILRISYENINVFSKGFTVDFTAFDRITDDAQVHFISKSISTQKVIGFAGINASGKTTALKLIVIAMEIVAKQRNLNEVLETCHIIKDDSKMVVDFIKDDMIYRLVSIFGISESKTDIQNSISCYFKEEMIYRKTCSSVKNKNQIFDFIDKPYIFRSALNDEIMKYLDNKQSMIRPITNGAKIYIYDSVFRTNFNILTTSKNTQMSFLNLFDNNIEILQEADKGYILKFKNDSHKYKFESFVEAADVVSSGTIKGSHVMSHISEVIKHGGYLVIDEIENHLNKKLVQMIIRLFTDNEINKKGACLLFTTHYTEIIDTIERKDNIYVLRKDEDMSATICRYSDYVKRNDIKKSDVLLSNFIEGSAPSYDLIMKVREDLCKEMS